MCSSCHGDTCTYVEETIIDDITDIGINDDTQDEELLFENIMQMTMQDHSQHVHWNKFWAVAVHSMYSNWLMPFARQLSEFL